MSASHQFIWMFHDAVQSRAGRWMGLGADGRPAARHLAQIGSLLCDAQGEPISVSKWSESNEKLVTFWHGVIRVSFAYMQMTSWLAKLNLIK